MNSVEKLAAIGCGKEIINSQIERSRINAAISRLSLMFKYQKHAVKTGICSLDDSFAYVSKYWNEFKSEQFLIEKYSAIYSEKYYKLKLEFEKFNKI